MTHSLCKLESCMSLNHDFDIQEGKKTSQLEVFQPSMHIST